MELIKTLLEQQPLMALFLTIAIGYLVGEINIKGFSLGVGAVLVRRARHGLVRAEIGAGADGGNARPCTLPLWRWRPVRQAVLHRAGQPRGAPGEPDRADRRAVGGRGEPPVREDDGHRSRRRAGTVRGLGNEHAHAAGSHRDARQRRPGGGLFRVVPVRRRGADPVPLPRVHDHEAEDRGAHIHRPRNPRNRAAQPGPLRQDAR